MSDYVKSTNFAIKDGLTTTDPAKVIKGTEIDNEYNAISNAIATKANTNSPALTGTPTAPTATAGTNTTQIASCAFVLANAIPSGMITMWSGTIATIPSGWYLCDGNNSTPDLRNKFIVGAYTDETSLAKTSITGSNTQTGGSKDAVNVSHTHTATTTVADATITGTFPNASQSSSYYTGPFTRGDGFSSNGANVSGNYVTNFSSTHNPTATTTNSTEGSSGTNANLPPYFALAYIMKG